MLVPWTEVGPFGVLPLSCGWIHPTIGCSALLILDTSPESVSVDEVVTSGTPCRGNRHTLYEAGAGPIPYEPGGEPDWHIWVASAHHGLEERDGADEAVAHEAHAPHKRF